MPILIQIEARIRDFVAKKASNTPRNQEIAKVNPNRQDPDQY